MSFGKTLKRIRLKHKDSLRGLAKKIDLHFTFIDKVEKGTAPISKNFIAVSYTHLVHCNLLYPLKNLHCPCSFILSIFNFYT